MRKTLAIFLVVILLAFCSCDRSKNISRTGSDASLETSDAAISGFSKALYPYVDTEGRTRYQLYINGKIVDTQHDPYTYPQEPNGAYYPIVEVLDYLGVGCLFDEHLMTLTTKVNGRVITCSADNKDIVVGKTTLGGTAPEYIEGCFYVPSFTFMELLDAVVDFNSNRSAVTMTTDIVINKSQSGVSGLTISPETAKNTGEKLHLGSEACSTCGGTGKSMCTKCSGTGSVTQYSQSRDIVTGQMTIKNTKTICSGCSGSGRSTCKSCGGSGKR